MSNQVIKTELQETYVLNPFAIDRRTTFYMKHNGAIVACRFTKLDVDLGRCSYRECCRQYPTCDFSGYIRSFDFTLKLATGETLDGCGSWLPKLYTNIDDCLHDGNTNRGIYYKHGDYACLYGAVVDMVELAETLPFFETWSRDLADVCGCRLCGLLAYHFDKNRMSPVLGKVFDLPPYSILDKQLKPQTATTRQYYRTCAECSKNNPILVYNF